MKSFYAYTFVALYLLAMIRPVLPLFEYVIYEDYIAEFLCINKDKVEMQCNGKCYLMQKLEQQNDDKKQNLPKISIEEYPIGFIDILFLKPQSDQLVQKERTVRYQNNYFYLYSDHFFHPPSNIS
ncbi:MAG: hypothetical protein WBG90_20075 [Saonia sp.]